jgi:hypothetical protein
MSVKQRRILLKNKNEAASRRLARKTATLPPPSEEETNDVRPEKVAKARQLIRHSAYPSDKVVDTLALQIARFF